MAHLENEIQHWLKKSLSLEQVAELVSRSMAKDLKDQKFKNLKTGFIFLARSGQTPTLFQFIFDYLWTQPDKWPWPLLVEATTHLWQKEKPELLKWLIEGAFENEKSFELSKNYAYRNLISQYADFATAQLTKRKTEIRHRRQELIDQLVTFSSQKLFDSEKNLLIKLALMFPNDSEIKNLHQEHKKKYAHEILDRKLKHQRMPVEISRPTPETPEDKEWAHLMLSAHLALGKKYPHIKKDLIISALMLDLTEVAYQVFVSVPAYEDLTWLSLEVLLATRRFAELLNALAFVEVDKAAHSETFFATAYYRAQAYWGLGQKKMALQAIEGLLATRPQYRSAQALWNQWSSK